MSVSSQTQATVATILNTASLSDAIDLSAGRLVALIMPAAWTTAAITIVASDTLAGTYSPVYDDGGTELSITAAASRVIAVKSLASAIAPLSFIKLRSGTLASPVAQGADRLITVLVK